jgi:hypothetical protein
LLWLLSYGRGQHTKKPEPVGGPLTPASLPWPPTLPPFAPYGLAVRSADTLRTQD